MKEYFLDNTGELTFNLDPVRNPLSDDKISELVYEATKDFNGDFKLVAYRFARLIEKAHGIV
jgi:hypothetical protein